MHAAIAEIVTHVEQGPRSSVLVVPVNVGIDRELTLKFVLDNHNPITYTYKFNSLNTTILVLLINSNNKTIKK